MQQCEDEVVRAFARDLLRRREAEGLTLEELAERAGLTPNYIGNIENGQRDPSLSTVLKLASALRIEPGEFFGAHGISSAGLEFGRMLDAVPEPIRVHVEGVLRFFSRAVHK